MTTMPDLADFVVSGFITVAEECTASYGSFLRSCGLAFTSATTLGEKLTVCTKAPQDAFTKYWDTAVFFIKA
jgi:hypothetical protein